MGSEAPVQLVLPIRLADHARLDNFYAGPNAPLAAALRAAARGGRGGPVWIAGPPGSGRTHLLQAVVAEVAPPGVAVYLPLDRDAALPPGVLEGLGTAQLVALDDVDAVAGDPAFERALFVLCEGLRAGGGRLVAAARADVHQCGFGLPDLASRLAAGLRFAIEPLDDAGRLAALQLRARFRGLDLPDETGRYLLNRVERSLASLCRLLDDLDLASLQSGRRLTVPFVRSLIG
jgi:DnaA family protein